MYDLMNIKECVQQVSNAISAVLNVEVEVFNSELYRIAGTGRYKAMVGNKKDDQSSSVIRKVISTKQPLFYDKENSPTCVFCNNRGNCEMRKGLTYPIFKDNNCIGFICLYANKGSQEKIFDEQSVLLKFIDEEAGLLLSKIHEEEISYQLCNMAKLLSTVVNFISEGIIAIDSNSIITHLNKEAQNLLKIDAKDYLGQPVTCLLNEKDFNNIVSMKWKLSNNEFFIKVKNSYIRILASVSPMLNDSEDVLGFVITFKDSTKAKQDLFEISGAEKSVTFDDIIGGSALINAVKEKAKVFAKGDSSILLQGGTGTGKELFARAIHYESSRENGPFIAINCAAIPESLLESELFGYEKGAFTGANERGKPGKIELANGGTLFLDELGDMPLYLQSKLLRVLQERQLMRLGGTKHIKINMRVISATNKDLTKLMQEGNFRSDLFYRLNVIPLYIPPLRERKEDIPILLNYFLSQYTARVNKKQSDFSPRVYKILTNHSWPGNVRELANVVEYAVNYESSNIITEKSLPPYIFGSISDNKLNPVDDYDISMLENTEKELILKGLTKYGRSKKAKIIIAGELGIGIATLYRRMKKYGL